MEKMMNAAIITARRGSKSIKEKNIYPLLGKPLVQYPIEYSKAAQKVDEVFISTDSPEIAKLGQSLGCTIIDRPEELCDDHVNHGDVIQHAVTWVNELHPEMRNVVLLLGNSVMLSANLIDTCLTHLDEDSSLDSVMTIWEAADDHPFRALEIQDGFVTAWSGKPTNISTERQSYPSIYYYDQGVWAFRKDCAFREEGPAPWWWMGKRCKPIVRPWVTGRDIHTMFDLLVAQFWLEQRSEFESLEQY